MTLRFHLNETARSVSGLTVSHVYGKTAGAERVPSPSGSLERQRQTSTLAQGCTAGRFGHLLTGLLLRAGNGQHVNRASKCWARPPSLFLRVRTGFRAARCAARKEGADHSWAAWLSAGLLRLGELKEEGLNGNLRGARVLELGNDRRNAGAHRQGYVGAREG